MKINVVSPFKKIIICTFSVFVFVLLDNYISDFCNVQVKSAFFG